MGTNQFNDEAAQQALAREKELKQQGKPTAIILDENNPGTAIFGPSTTTIDPDILEVDQKFEQAIRDKLALDPPEL